MRAFIQRLRTLLQSLPRPSVPPWPLDIVVYRRGVLNDLNQIDEPPEHLEMLHHEWLEEARFEQFLSDLGSSLPESFPVRTRQEFDELMACALRRSIHYQLRAAGQPAWLTLPQLAELDHQAKRAWESATVHGYAQRIGLLLRDEQADKRPWRLTQVGQIFLDLSGAESVRWLLQLEIVRHGEPGLLSPALAHRWVSGEITRYRLQDDERELYFRLKNLGVILDARDSEVNLSSFGRNLLATFARDEDSIRQARMIAHELNNVLPPIRPAMEDLFQTLNEAHRTNPQIDKYRARIEVGVERALRFVNELSETVQLARRTGREALDIAACLREAIASLNGDAMAISMQPLPALPPLRGQRDSLIKALAELLRNALRAAQDHQQPQIRIEAQLVGQHIQVTIDDNGPGVPSEQREAIFVEGFSSRRGGGQGLTLVREILRALGGSVSCADSPLGGARFALTLPIYTSVSAVEASS